MTFMHTRIERKLPKEVRAWLKQEAREQKERYKKIVAEMKALDETRDQWYEEFLERIQKYGFNTDGDDRLKIPDSDLPVKPKRRHKVVY